jgi:hypothetical protein
MFLTRTGIPFSVIDPDQPIPKYWFRGIGTFLKQTQQEFNVTRISFVI